MAGAVAALVLIPLVLSRGDNNSGFASRGAGSAIAAFELACSKDVCQSGDTLVFDVSASAGYQYFAAFAQREDGAVLWYFPESPDGESLDLRARLREGVLDRGVVLGGDHDTGLYTVFGIFSNDPLSRDAIKARFTEDATDVGVGTAVSTREFAVQ